MGKGSKFGKINSLVKEYIILKKGKDCNYCHMRIEKFRFAPIANYFMDTLLSSQNIMSLVLLSCKGLLFVRIFIYWRVSFSH